MRATAWEFKNRAMVFGMIFGCPFLLYAFDHQTSSVALINWIEARTSIDATLLAHLLFAAAACFLALAALIRTWASSYLHADIVYASEVKSASLVADGPYRRVRNPLYLGNIMMAVAAGAMMSRSGFVVAVALMVLFCYRLILREEFELRSSQGAQFEAYRKAVPRLFFSPVPRIPSSGRPADWGAGFKAEIWFWAFPAGMAAFAITLKLGFFFGVAAVSLAIFWLLSYARRRKTRPQS